MGNSTSMAPQDSTPNQMEDDLTAPMTGWYDESFAFLKENPWIIIFILWLVAGIGYDIGYWFHRREIKHQQRSSKVTLQSDQSALELKHIGVSTV